jgi:hypothetical protein
LIIKDKRSNIIKFFALTLLVLSSATYSFAQCSGNANHNIIEPISIVWVGNMNFSNVAVSSKVAGTVLLAPAGTFKARGGVRLHATKGTATAACISVNGLGNSTYSITLPTTVTLTNGVNTIMANAFTSNPATSGLIAVGGSQVLSVGATLNIEAAKPAGLYVGSAFAVTVNYN